MTGAALDIEAVSVRLGGRPVLSGVSAQFAAGQFIALVGPNGAGKSSLLRAIAGLNPIEGTIRLDGRDAATQTSADRARRIGYLPQGHQTHWPLPVRDVVALGRFPHGARDPRRLAPADADAVETAMRQAGVAQFADRPATRLSGGEKARVALARVLAQEPRILLADEPTASLDPRYQIEVMALLRDIAATGTLVIAATHDLGLAARHADRIWVLEGGRAETPAPARDALSPQVLARVFRIQAGLEGPGCWETAP